MRLTETMKEANKWLERKPSKFEKILYMMLTIVAATIFMGAALQ